MNITRSKMCKCRRDKRTACAQCFALEHKHCGCCKLHSCCRENTVLKTRNKSDLTIGCQVVGGSRNENGVSYKDFFAPTPYTPAVLLPQCVSDIYERLGMKNL